MEKVREFPYKCENCHFWRYSRMDKAHVCINPESAYYGEAMDSDTCCLNHVKKREEKK